MFTARSGETEPDRSAAPQAEPADVLLRQIGQWLREARLQHGVELDDVAEELRIRPPYLQGLEEGDLSAMPGRAYALGFLRTYASHLGIDGEDLVHRVKAAERGGGGGGHPELSVPTPITEHRLPRAQLVLLSVALVAVLYGGWRYVDGDARPPAEGVAEVPVELRDEVTAELDGVPAAATVSDPVRAYASERPEFLPPYEPEAVGPAQTDDVAPPAVAEPAVAEPAVAELEPEPEPAVAVAPSMTGEGAAADGGPIAEAFQADTAASEDGPGLAEPRLAERPPMAAGAEPEAGAPAVDREVERTVAAVLMADIDLVPAEEAGAEGEQEEGAADDQPSASELLAALDTSSADRADAARVFGRGNGEGRVRLEAVETSWIQVRSADGTYTYTRTLQPGDVYLVPGRTDLALWTGNAGGLRVVVDDRTLRPLGASREVVRDVPLDPDALLAR